VPVPAGLAGGLGGTAGWFPLVGAAVGALAGSVRLAGEHLLGRAPASVLSLLTLVVVTGALHQDGLADTADALGARGERDRRLEAMRDPATGAFGACALIGWALLMLTTLSSMSATHALVALTVACALARWAALLHAAATRAARTEGLGAAMQVGLPALTWATLAAAALSLGPAPVLPGLIALVVTVALAASSAVIARRTFGGRTGDTLGATVALTEALVSLVLLAAWHGWS